MSEAINSTTGNPQWDIPASVDVGNQTTCTLIGLEAGQTYAFAVTAYDTHGEREKAYKIMRQC